MLGWLLIFNTLIAGLITSFINAKLRGIGDEDKQKIFDRFFRVDKARSRSQGGLGLGLSLALAIVRQHGGSIKVLDNKPRGTIMYVKLPTTVK